MAKRQRLTFAYSEGYWAHYQGMPLAANPYPEESKELQEWDFGWMARHAHFGRNRKAAE